MASEAIATKITGAVARRIPDILHGRADRPRRLHAFRALRAFPCALLRGGRSRMHLRLFVSALQALDELIALQFLIVGRRLKGLLHVGRFHFGVAHGQISGRVLEQCKDELFVACDLVHILCLVCGRGN